MNQIMMFAFYDELQKIAAEEEKKPMSALKRSLIGAGIGLGGGLLAGGLLSRRRTKPLRDILDEMKKLPANSERWRHLRGVFRTRLDSGIGTPTSVERLLPLLGPGVGAGAGLTTGLLRRKKEQK